MKKIAIYTLPGNFNYGNRLQNYALQQTLINLGFETETLEIVSPGSTEKIKKIMKHLKRVITHPSTFPEYFVKREYGKGYHEMSKIKSPYLLPFSSEFIKTVKYEKKHLNEVDKKYDFFITGSDQVWNMTSTGSDIAFLQFATPEKRISYAASFGKSNISKADQKFFKDKINGMKYISVREDAGKKIVENLTNKKAEVHLDPTMLLSKKEWQDMITKSKDKVIYEKPYILIYALRGISESMQHEINELAKVRNYEIKYIMGDFIEEGTDIVTVPQFVSAIDGAELVVTDSFHGTVFSILMNTAFIVLQRTSGNMNSRIDTLLKKFKFEDNIEGSTKTLTNITDFTDFTDVEKIRENEKIKSIAYLKGALK